MNIVIKSLIRAILPRTIRPHRILFGPLKGQRIVTSWHDYPGAIMGSTERPLLKWFAENVKIGTTWLDIGAHYGYTAIALGRLVGQHGRVFAFEPMIGTAGYITRTRQLNNLMHLTVIPMGLSAPETLEVKKLPVTRGMVDSTLEIHRPEMFNLNETWMEPFIVTRFDWLWPCVCGENPQIDGVKIDVQGMEIEVLTGMIETLRRYQPKLVVELHRGVDREKFLHAIELAGYSCDAIPIEPIAGEASPLYMDDHSYFFHMLHEAVT
jgi:FkbM family methyltransferase